MPVELGGLPKLRLRVEMLEAEVAVLRAAIVPLLRSANQQAVDEAILGMKGITSSQYQSPAGRQYAAKVVSGIEAMLD